MYLTLAAAGFFGIIVLITLLRAEKSVANGALTVITLVAVGIAVAATLRGNGPAGGAGLTETRSPLQVNASLPALSCIDDLAGETVLTACEKVLFGSSESVAAAVSYTSARLGRLTTLGDVAAANRNMTPEVQALRRSIERDRYGLAAYVLLVRDHCTPSDCAAFAALTDRNRIVANMEERTYDGLVTRYSPSWNAPAAAAVTGALAGFPPSMPTGRPTNADFPSAASTPPVSIMSPEPPVAGSRAPAAAANTPAQAPRPTVVPAVAAAKKPAPKPRAASAPVQIAPAAHAAAPAAAPAPAASND
jgi:hypothetical protein